MSSETAFSAILMTQSDIFAPHHKREEPGTGLYVEIGFEQHSYTSHPPLRLPPVRNLDAIVDFLDHLAMAIGSLEVSFGAFVKGLRMPDVFRCIQIPLHTYLFHFSYSCSSDDAYDGNDP